MKDPDTLTPILGIEPLVGCDEDKEWIVPHVIARTSLARSMDIADGSSAPDGEETRTGLLPVTIHS